MDPTKVASFTNVQSSQPVIFLHGQMEMDRIHRMLDLEPVVHRHLEAIFKIRLALVEIMQAIQVNVGIFVRFFAHQMKKYIFN